MKRLSAKITLLTIFLLASSATAAHVLDDIHALANELKEEHTHLAELWAQLYSNKDPEMLENFQDVVAELQAHIQLLEGNIQSILNETGINLDLAQENAELLAADLTDNQLAKLNATIAQLHNEQIYIKEKYDKVVEELNMLITTSNGNVQAHLQPTNIQNLPPLFTDIMRLDIIAKANDPNQMMLLLSNMVIALMSIAENLERENLAYALQELDRHIGAIKPIIKPVLNRIHKQTIERLEILRLLL